MHTKEDIERSFTILKNDIIKHSKSGTSCDDVLRYMYENSDRVWFMSWDLIGKTTKGGKFLSHRSPARLSDLAINEPHLVEDRKIGRFKAYRLRTENANLIEARLGVKGNWKQAELPKKQEVEIKIVDGKPVAVLI